MKLIRIFKIKQMEPFTISYKKNKNNKRNRVYKIIYNKIQFLTSMQMNLVNLIIKNIKF